MMKMIPIQVTEEGVFIPKSYLKETDNLEIIVVDDYILVRPQLSAQKHSDKQTKPEAVPTKPRRRFSFIGSGQTRNPKAAVEAEAILNREVDPREGWSLDE